MAKRYSKQKEAWNKLARCWVKYVTPPAKPCEGLLKIWEEIVKQVAKKVENPKALILGATPELRDLLLKYNFDTIAYDINPNMLKAMEKLMSYKNHPKNKKISGSWLKMNFKKNSFDLILGHQSLGQILNVRDLRKLLDRLKKILKPSGFLLICEVVREKIEAKITERNRAELFKKYQKKKILECELHNFLKYNSDWNPYSKSPSSLGTLAIYKKIKELSRRDKTIKKFYLWWEKVLGGKNKRVLVFFKKDLEKLLRQYFKLLPIEQCHDFPFCKYMPCYLLKKGLEK